MFVVDYQQATKHVESRTNGWRERRQVFSARTTLPASDAAPEVTTIEYLNIVIYL